MHVERGKNVKIEFIGNAICLSQKCFSLNVVIECDSGKFCLFSNNTLRLEPNFCREKKSLINNMINEVIYSQLNPEFVNYRILINCKNVCHSQIIFDKLLTNNWKIFIYVFIKKCAQALIFIKIYEINSKKDRSGVCGYLIFQK